MPLLEALRYTFGVLIIPLAALHILATRLMHEVYGVEDSYLYVVTAHWAFDPIDALQQAVLVLVVWSHGCIGLHLWLRLQPLYPTAAPAPLAIADMLQALAPSGHLPPGQGRLR